MARKVSHDIIDQLGQGATFFNQQLEEEGKWLAQKYDSDAKELINALLLPLLSPEGYRNAIDEAHLVESTVKATGLPVDSIRLLIRQLESKHYFRRNEDDQIELSDNSLARQIKQKLEVDSEIIRRAENFVRNAFAGFLATKTLLDKEGLNYINPYEYKMQLSDKERDFITRSKRKVRRDNWKRYIIFFVIIGLLSLMVASLWAQRRELRDANDIKDSLLEDKESLLQVLNSTNAQLVGRNFSLDSINRELTSARDSLSLANRDLFALKTRLELALDSLINSNREILRLQALSEGRADSLEQFADSLQNFLLTLQEQNTLIRQQKAQIEIFARQTEEIKNVALTRNVANDMVQLGDENAQLKGLLAATVFAMNQELYGGDVDHPSIIRALHNATKSLGAETVEELEEGGLRKFIRDPQNPGKIYISSGFGSVESTMIESWEGPVMPALSGSLDLIPPQGFPVTTMALLDNGYFVIGGLHHALSMYHIPSSQKEEIRVEGMIQAQSILPLSGQRFVFLALRQGGMSSLMMYDFDTKAMSAIVDLKGVANVAVMPEDHRSIIVGFEDKRILKVEIPDATVTELLIAESPVTALDAFSYPDSDQARQTYLAVGMASGSFQIFDTESARNIVYQKTTVPLQSPVYNYGGSKFHEARISDIVLSPDKRFLGVSSFDGRATFWDLEKCLINKERGYLPIQFTDQQSWVYGMLFSEDSKKVLVAESSDRIHVYALDPQLYIDEICARLNRSLTPDEWELYFGPDFQEIAPCKNSN